MTEFEVFPKEKTDGTIKTERNKKRILVFQESFLFPYFGISFGFFPFLSKDDIQGGIATMKQCKENKDLLAKEYLRDQQVFADLINLSLYQGKRIVHPKELEEADPVIQNKRRDVLKRWKREKGKEVYLGIEVQSTIDPTMPVRVMEYDVLCYRDQLKQKQKATNRNQLQKGEFLSGIHQGEKLHEVITVVLNLSGKRWNGARSLCEMLEEGEMASEYRIRVLDPVEIREEAMKKCISEVGKLMRVMSVCEKKEEFEKCIKGEEYRRVGVKTAKMIRVFANIISKS